jgi:hypothetical protein
MKMSVENLLQRRHKSFDDGHASCEIVTVAWSGDVARNEIPPLAVPSRNR